MKHPITLAGHLISPTLTGQKTQTRTPLQPQPAPIKNTWTYNLRVFATERDLRDYILDHTEPPLGQEGDLLWVRETWRYDGWTEDGLPWIRYKADDYTTFISRRRIPRKWLKKLVIIHADLLTNPDDTGHPRDKHWRSPVTMPPWASTIPLQITDVKLERLQDMTEDDARHEGYLLRSWDSLWKTAFNKRDVKGKVFSDAWDLKHSKDGLTWDKNPWVWVTHFRQV